MIKKVTSKEFPELFEDLREFEVEKTYEEHRRGSNYFVARVIEFKPEHKKFFPNVPNYEDYLGFWETDTIIEDYEYGCDDEHSELTRVEKVEKISYEWQPVK